MKNHITQELVDEINRLLSFGLTKGLRNPVQGEMCVEAAVCKGLNLVHGDNLSEYVAEFVRIPKNYLNDCNWSSNQARAKGMAKLAIAQLGSVDLDETEFISKLRVFSAKLLLPFLIQKHYDIIKDKKLLEYKVKFESLTELNHTLWNEFCKCHYAYYSSSYYSSYCYYDSSYYDSYGDEWLLLVADTMLLTLKQMNCEGCKWIKE